jgi:hypothetical protein
MIDSLPAISLSSTFRNVGAIVAFVSLAGLAVLSLLAVRQGRQIKGLREWAGTAPERAIEEQDRLRAEASLRGQQPGTQAYRTDNTRRTTVAVSLLIAAVAATVVAALAVVAGGTQATHKPRSYDERA